MELLFASDNLFDFDRAKQTLVLPTHTGARDVLRLICFDFDLTLAAVHLYHSLQEGGGCGSSDDELLAAYATKYENGNDTSSPSSLQRMSVAELKDKAASLGIHDPDGHNGRRATWITAILDVYSSQGIASVEDVFGGQERLRWLTGCLQQLRDTGARLFVVTKGSVAVAAHALRRCGLDVFFEGITDDNPKQQAVQVLMNTRFPEGRLRGDQAVLVDDDPNNFADASTQDSLQELTSPEGFRLFFQQSEACPAMGPSKRGAAACLGRSRQGYCKTMLVAKSTGVTEEQLQYLVQQASQQPADTADTAARTVTQGKVTADIAARTATLVHTQGTVTGHEHDAWSKDYKDAGAMSASQEIGNAATMVCPALSALTYAWATDQLHLAMVRAVLRIVELDLRPYIFQVSGCILMTYSKSQSIFGRSTQYHFKPGAAF
jgi:hypothetical protein